MENIQKQGIKNAYKKAKVEMMGSLKELNRCVKNRLHRGERNLNYGHVGDMHHINGLLRELIDFIN